MAITKKLPDIFMQTLEHASDGVVVIDANNYVVLFNNAAEELWGYSREEVIGEHVNMLLSGSILGRHDDYIKSSRSAGVNNAIGITRGAPIPRKDGGQRWGEISISRIESEDQVLFTAFVRDVTAQHEERQRAHLLSLVSDHTDSAILITDSHWNIIYVNKGFETTFGYSFCEVEGRQPTSFLTPNLSKFRILDVGKRLSRGLSLKAEELTQVKGGDRIWCNIAISPIFSNDEKFTNTVTVLTDITSSKVHQVLQFCILDAMVRDVPLEELMDLICKEIERIAPEIMAVVIQVDEDGRMHPVSAPSLPAANIKSIDGMLVSDCVGPSSKAAFFGESVVTSDIELDSDWAILCVYFSTLGIKSCWSIPIKNSKDVSVGVLEFHYKERRVPSLLHQQMVDVISPLCALAMERAVNQESIRQLAYYDSLTELPNRSLLHAKADHALIEARRTKTSMAVLFIDLDRFKQVNDSLGHPAGDELLKVIAGRLHSGCRSSDIIGRLSGDEFVVILPGCGSEHVTEIVEELKDSISKPLHIAGSVLTPSASIGISMYPQDGHDMGTLIHRADMAMYQAKGVGRGRFSFFSNQLNSLAQERQALEAALRYAIENAELRLNYQPQINMDDGTLYGVEALARWTHTKFGEVSPARFIPLAEECGLIGELGHWAIQESCRQLASWRRKGLNIPSVSVNLSPSNFHNLDLCGMIMRTLAKYNLTTEDLTLELTESVLLDTNPSTMEVIHEVYAQGVKISMDDFGTGYSSLSYLRKLPIQELKLDRSFVRDLETDETSRTLSDAVLRIGESLRMKIVAEGIEGQGQYKILKDQGYHIAQGYLLSRPLSAKELEVWIDSHRER